MPTSPSLFRTSPLLPSPPGKSFFLGTNENFHMPKQHFIWPRKPCLTQIFFIKLISTSILTVSHRSSTNECLGLHSYLPSTFFSWPIISSLPPRPREQPGQKQQNKFSPLPSTVNFSHTRSLLSSPRLEIRGQRLMNTTRSRCKAFEKTNYGPEYPQGWFLY